jgi:hypothetical protein
MLLSFDAVLARLQKAQDNINAPTIGTPENDRSAG